MPVAPETTRSGPRPAMLLALFAGAALISGFTLLREIDPFDEGLMLQAARRVAEGQTPYADFSWPYGPAQPYLLALFGDSLVPWRVIRVLVDAGVALTAYLIVRREAGERWALVAWLAAACAMAQPTGANPYAPALLLGLLAIYQATGPQDHRTTGVLLGTAAAFRPDFAVFAAAGVLTVLFLRTPHSALRAALYALGTATLVYLPFAIAAGPADLYDNLVATSLRESDYWSLPFPYAFDEQFRFWPPRDFAEDLKDLLGFYIPLILVVSLAAAARSALRTPHSALGVFVAGCGYLLYLLSRTDEFHATPLLVALACALAILAARAGRREALVLGALLGLMLAYGAANRLSALLLPPDLAKIEAPAADGVSTRPPEAAALNQVVPLVRARVPADEPIYVAPLRSDIVRIGNPLLYVLTDRDNAARRDFGLLSRAKEQRETVADLEREAPPVIVRWTDPVSVEREPNLRGRSSGVRILDDWIGDHYVLERRFGHYDVLVPR